MKKVTTYFDHCYQKISSSEEYFNLKSHGFEVSDRFVEHEGQQICRFIKFPKRDQSSSSTAYQYIEFAEILDVAALKKNYDAGTSSDLLWEPGLSLGFNGGLKDFFQTQSELMQKLDAELTHKNYVWKEDSTSNLPGWNFLTFKKPVFDGIYIWGTEYEKIPGKGPATPPEIHPNTVDHFHGFVWNADITNTLNLATLCDSAESRDEILFGDNIKIHFADLKLNPHFADKTQPFWAVVFSCRNWETFLNIGKPHQIFEWKGKNVGQIKLGPKGWDILVLEP